MVSKRSGGQFSREILALPFREYFSNDTTLV